MLFHCPAKYRRLNYFEHCWSAFSGPSR